MLKTREFTVEIEKIHDGENPLRLEGENKGIAEPAESIIRIGLINPLIAVPDNGRREWIGQSLFAQQAGESAGNLTVRKLIPPDLCSYADIPVILKSWIALSNLF